jgi:uncharacterized protein
MKQQLYVAAGTVSLGIGVVGIIIPVLPTTPFLLLAAVCYLRGSQKLYASLLRNRLIGTYISNYLEGRGMSVKMKIWTLALLWITIISTAMFAVDGLIIRIILAAVLAGVTFHILLIKTVKQH